jgi:hypothetical protein
MFHISVQIEMASKGFCGIKIATEKELHTTPSTTDWVVTIMLQEPQYFFNCLDITLP